MAGGRGALGKLRLLRKAPFSARISALNLAASDCDSFSLPLAPVLDLEAEVEVEDGELVLNAGLVL